MLEISSNTSVNQTDLEPDEKVATSIKRLGRLHIPDPNFTSKAGFIDHILAEYEIPNIGQLGFQERSDLAMEMLTFDLLQQTWFDTNGALTKYAHAYTGEFGPMDIQDYRYIGLESIAWYNFLVKNFEGEGSSQQWLVDRYLEVKHEKGEPPPILIIPGYISIENDHILMQNATGFVLPLGGNETAITVFALHWHNIFKTKPDQSKAK